jgi:cell division septum initiation protein DivIVA
MGTPRSDVEMWSSSPGAIPPPAFSTTRRGYDQAEVTDYVRRLTARLQTLEKEVGSLRSEIGRARRERDAAIGERDEALRGRAGDAYEQVSSHVAELMMGVDREVERIQAEARAEVERLVAGAEKDASRLREEAEAQRRATDEANRLAREEAERSLADLTSERERMLEELRHASTWMREVIAGLEAPSEDEPGNEAAPVVIPELHDKRAK